jgi:hypothetical protein
MFDMRRRDVVAFLGGVAAGGPRATADAGGWVAQSASAGLVAAFPQRLNKLGYVEGQNVAIGRHHE